LRVLVAVALTAAIAACGSDSRSNGETVITGIIVVPEQGCPGCRGEDQLVRVQALVEGGDPATIKCVLTSPRGVYDTSQNVVPCPEPTSAQFEPAGDGDQTVIVVANVGATGEDDGPQIGGVLATPIGVTKSKDFNGTTQIACVASVFLTQGNRNPAPGCVVLPSCPGPTSDGVDCFEIVDPNSIRDDQIENLESASAFVSDQISYPGGVEPAVCAVLACTESGARATTAECVQGRLGR
jgi:hypothetical protein